MPCRNNRPHGAPGPAAPCRSGTEVNGAHTDRLPSGAGGGAPVRSARGRQRAVRARKGRVTRRKTREAPRTVGSRRGSRWVLSYDVVAVTSSVSLPAQEVVEEAAHLAAAVMCSAPAREGRARSLAAVVGGCTRLSVRAASRGAHGRRRHPEPPGLGHALPPPSRQHASARAGPPRRSRCNRR